MGAAQARAADLTPSPSPRQPGKPKGDLRNPSFASLVCLYVYFSILQPNFSQRNLFLHLFMARPSLRGRPNLLARPSLRRRPNHVASPLGNRT